MGNTHNLYAAKIVPLQSRNTQLSKDVYFPDICSTKVHQEKSALALIVVDILVQKLILNTYLESSGKQSDSFILNTQIKGLFMDYQYKAINNIFSGWRRAL